MSDVHLKTYIDDHLALLVGECELTQRCLGSNDKGELAADLKQLHSDLEKELAILRDVLQRVGGSESRMKQGAAWLAEKVGRLKPNNEILHYSDLSRLVEIEALTLAAQGRRMFWQNLAAARPNDTRLVEVDIAAQKALAERHVETLDRHLENAAKSALV